MFFVSLTRLRVRSWRYLPAFFVQTYRSALQARSAEGVLAVSLLRDAHNTFWTRTVWNSEQAMKAYILSGIHRQVMRRLPQWCDEAAVAHWTQESPLPPSWEEAHQRLQQSGRPSKVNHPSEAHRNNLSIPTPRIRTTSELHFK
jgi:heme-degrading monooxygenase HmoA